MKRYLIIIAGMVMITQLHGMTKPEEAAPSADQTQKNKQKTEHTDSDAKKGEPTVQAAEATTGGADDSKKVDAKALELYQEKAREFVTAIAQNEVAYEHVFCGMREVKKACLSRTDDSFLYAFMSEKNRSQWVGENDKIFVKIYGLKFAKLVQEVACKKLNTTLTELTQAVLGSKKKVEEYERLVQPHMLALANEIIALLEPHVKPAKS